MPRLGISIRIDVTKIDKARIFEGAKGKYLDLTTFIDTDKEDAYGNHGFISQSVNKDEREQGVQTAILGNAKVFFGNNSQSSPQGYAQPASPQSGPSYGVDDDDDMPF